MKKLWGLLIILLGSFGTWTWWKKTHQGPEEVNFTSQPIKPATADDHTWMEFFKTRPEATWVIVGAVALLFFGEVFQKYSFVFKASLLDLPQTEFTGTNMPVKKVPIWTELTDLERTLTYDQIPKSKMMNLPRYDLSAMQNGKEWRPDNADDRNIYITYPVPNLGNYRLDGTENSGSHPGIDIKLPIGTPIHSIANGIVYKVQDKTTGFGKAVSIAHVNIPDPANQNEKVTLISTYAHLSKINVREGQTVTKDQVIGASGDTGFATAPHIHFQIDRDDAPFIPYWPFTWNEANQAGYSSTFEAVKAGFNKSKAQKYTVHPVNFIAQFQGFTNDLNLVVQSGEIDNQIIKTNPVTPPANVELAEVAPDFKDVEEDRTIIKKEAEEVTEAENIQTEETLKAAAPEVENNRIIKKETSSNNSEKITIEILTDKKYIPGEAEVVKINVNAAELINEPIKLTSTLKNRAFITPNVLNAKDFVNNVAEVAVTTDSEYPFKVIAEGEFGEEKSDSLRPEIFTDVPATHTFANAIKYLKDNKIVNGYEDGSFKPDNTLNRAEALKIILEANGISATENENVFTDVANDAWFAPYVNTAFAQGIVKGYSDGEFKAGNTVSRAEFLKMAIVTARFTPEANNTQPYPDVPSDAWFAPFFEFSKTHELIRMRKGGFIVPQAAINRGEAADVIYRLSQLIKR